MPFEERDWSAEFARHGFAYHPISGGSDGADGDGGTDDGGGNDAKGGKQGDDAGRDDAKDDAAGLKSALQKERGLKKTAEEARKAAETSAKDLQDRLDALEGKDKSDVERLTGERDRLKADIDRLAKDVSDRDARVRDLAVTQALTNAATKAGGKYPDLLVERLAKRAEVDGDLAVTNADDLVKEAKTQYPALFSVGKADGGAKDEDTNDAHVKPGLGRMQHAYATESKTKRSR